MKRKIACFLVLVMLCCITIGTVSADSYTNSEWSSFPTAKKGASGYRVRLIQKILLGFNTTTNSLISNGGGADGSFGSSTESAVKRYQDEKGLTIDGSVGPKTWKELGTELYYVSSVDGYRMYNVSTTVTGGFQLLVRRSSDGTWQFRTSVSGSWHTISN